MKFLEAYTEEEQKKVINITDNYQTRSFRYDLVDRLENFKKTLTNVSIKGNNISFDDFGDIKRSGTINLKIQDDDIDFLNDRVKIYVILNGYEFPLGVYLLSSPSKTNLFKNISSYHINIYEKTQILLEDKVNETYFIPSGTDYMTEITNIIEGSGLDVEMEVVEKATNRDKTYDIGTSKLKIVNELLDEINYEHVHTDNLGIVSLNKRVLDVNRTPEYFYDTDCTSIVSNGFKEDNDNFNIPNSFVIVATNPDNEPVISTFKNYDPEDPISIEARGREIDYYEEISDIADQETLDEILQEIIQVETKRYQTLYFTTSLNPLHVFNDCYMFDGIKYVESSFVWNLTVDGVMTHKCRRSINV